MTTWTTWEELLLTSAVKRHGLKDWNAIAMELQSRTSSVPNPVLLTAQICRTKFYDLRRRFSENTASEQNDVVGRGEEVDDGGDGGGGGGNSVPWLEDLKKLRMAELRRKVHGHDVSIQSLNSKVKRLEEEREQSMRENENGDQNPDLEKNSVERSGNNKDDVIRGVPPADDVAGVSVSGERSERENRSVNESNSTENRQTGEKLETETEPVQTGSVKQDPDTKALRADSWNDSSKPSEDKKVDDESAELHDSAAAESKEGTKESSDVQSSASLTRKSGAPAAGGDEPVVSPATMRRDSLKKSEPLVRFLDIIRAHKHGSTFEIRLESQKTEKYKSTIRQHVDLETVQTRIEDGSYSSCTTKFYLDILLLVNNAIAFFPKASAESAAAFELRKLILKDLNNKKQRIGRQSNPSPEFAPILIKTKPDPERSSDSLLSKQKSSVPFIVVCRKRSSISGSNKADGINLPRPTVKSSSGSPNEDEIPKEKPVTGVRSMRRSNNTRTNSTSISTSKNPITNSTSYPGFTNKGEVTKVVKKKKKNEVPNIVKRRGAADFLKRIKKSSPEDSNGSSRRDQSRDDHQKKKDHERKEVTARQKVTEENSPSKRGVGRPPKRSGREAAPVKRGKEGGEQLEVAAKRPNKRTKR